VCVSASDRLKIGSTAHRRAPSAASPASSLAWRWPLC
jgi:hypothetical protein